MPRKQHVPAVPGSSSANPAVGLKPVVSATMAIQLVMISLLGLSCAANAVAEDENITLTGDVLQVALPGTALAMTLGRQDTVGLAQFAASFSSAVGTTYALKLSIPKERPNGGDMSFPSGHTAAAFSGAAFLERRYGWRYGIPAYTAAAFVGFSRIQSDDHYPEDVLAGAAIGVLGAYLFTKPADRGLQVRCLIERGDYAMGLHFKW